MVGTTALALLAGGGVPAATGNVEQYDGVSWTEVANLSTARYGLGGGGTQQSAFMAGGYISANSNVTEEWTMAQNVKVITD